MSDFAQMPNNAAANNFRINGTRSAAGQKMGARFEAAAIASVPLSAHILGNTARGAATLASFPGAQSLQMPMVPRAMRSLLKESTPKPSFTQPIQPGGEMGRALSAVVKLAKLAKLG